MINYKDPPIENIPGPVAIDAVIKNIQSKLAASVPWLQKVFGRAHLQSEPPHQKAGGKSGQQGRDTIVPVVYYKMEPYDARPNDNLSAYSFFFVRDPLRFLEYDALSTDSRVSQPVSLIVWANLQKVNAAKAYDYTEELRGDILAVLAKFPGFVLEESYRQQDRVFAPFTISDTFRPFTKLPYTAFRIDGLLYYDYADTTCIPGEENGGALGMDNALNFTDFTFDSLTGEMVFAGGNPGLGLTQLDLYNSPSTGGNYINGENIGYSAGAFPGNTTQAEYFTPGDVLVKWRRVGSSAPFYPLTDWQQKVITVTRLSRRWLRVVKSVPPNIQEVYPGFPAVDVFNINGDNIGTAHDITELTAIWNGDAQNSAFGQIVAVRTLNAFYEVQIEPVPSANAYPIQYLFVNF